MIEHPDLLEMYMREHLADVDEDVHGHKAGRASRPNHHGLVHALTEPAHRLAAKLRHPTPRPDGTAAADGNATAATGWTSGDAAPGGTMPMPH